MRSLFPLVLGLWLTSCGDPEEPREDPLDLARQVERHLADGERARADAAWTALRERHPAWNGLGRVAHLLAQESREEYGALEAEQRTLAARLRGPEGVTRRLLRISRDAHRAANEVGDSINLRSTLWRLVRVAPQPDHQSWDRIRDLDARIPLARARAQEAEKERAALQEEYEALKASQRALEKAIYAPLVRAARYYADWDAAREASGASRDPEDLLAIGDMYFAATRLERALPDD